MKYNKHIVLYHKQGDQNILGNWLRCRRWMWATFFEIDRWEFYRNLLKTDDLVSDTVFLWNKFSKLKLFWCHSQNLQLMLQKCYHFHRHILKKIMSIYTHKLKFKFPHEKSSSNDWSNFKLKQPPSTLLLN